MGAGDQGRQVADRFRLLDLGNEAKLFDARRMGAKRLLQQIKILRPADKGITEHVGIANDGSKITFILGGQGRQAECRIRQVQSFFRFQLDATGLHTGHPQKRFAFGDAFDDGFQLTVIITQLVARLDPFDDLRQ
ncbi:hypothetical protein D3C73_526560 [compost metagenome]